MNPNPWELYLALVLGACGMLFTVLLMALGSGVFQQRWRAWKTKRKLPPGRG